MIEKNKINIKIDSYLLHFKNLSSFPISYTAITQHTRI